MIRKSAQTMTSRSRRSNARPQLSEKATAHIRGLIMSGELRPGTLVRPETIGEDLGISTTPAREALQALRVEGFLELVPRHGFVVGPLTGQDIRDLFQVQALIGGELAARAAAKATEQDVAELEALHHELIAAAARNDHDRLEEKNHAFHREINLLADSRKIIWALGLVTRYVPRQFYSSIPGWPRATMDDHAELLQAMKAKDPEATRVAMQQHLVHSGELLASHFDARVAAAETDNEPMYIAQTDPGEGLATA
ncbi:GntR family transcriptional regulator [Arthrobacter bambusae]|uniref:GntR family transcriptional regulator n=1 Tax=Arthrobacter bambusae TaxID=1338426 RepID=UPI00278BADE3|nr:GntR family transcriptional regulator [Arthrobacter bambusae]MDQ0029082.1 DNA-binding GntR family transcriptional regulator [Arthrobacter bambusae]MDQ0098516.1 DNA-binding GntR family transcriptional regulator [Arthrobacter bambusae]